MASWRVAAGASSSGKGVISGVSSPRAARSSTSTSSHAVAPVGRLDARLVGEPEERHRQGPAADPDDGEVAELADDGRGEAQRAVGPDEVQHDVGTQAVGRLADRPPVGPGRSATGRRPTLREPRARPWGRRR